MNTPFIKLLSFGDNYYIYDVNLNDIIKVSYESYIIMQELVKNNHENCNAKLNCELMHYYNAGYFRSNQIINIKNIEMQEILNLLNTRLKSLLIQVTRDCNLRCSYCFYSGKYKNIRTHENSYMEKELCFKIVDYFMQRTIHSPEINIGFYGGEPLLNFELIKDTVEYVEKNYPSSNIKYSVTTNGTLLTSTITDYLIKKQFLITISIDGPKIIHDSNRIFVNGSGSYDIIYKNIKYIYDNNYDFFISNIRYNAVITQYRNIVEKYFKNDPMIKKIKGKLSPLNNYHANSITQKQSNNEFNIENSSNTSSKKIRTFINYLKNNNTQSEDINRIRQLMGKLSASYEYPKTETISAGVCIPGISRLFCNINGDFYMCEKLDDNSLELKIGDVYKGWNKENIDNLANISNQSEVKGCKNCWAIHLCNMCAAKICALDAENLNIKCDEVRRSVEYDLINIFKLQELKKAIK